MTRPAVLISLTLLLVVAAGCAGGGDREETTAAAETTPSAPATTRPAVSKTAWAVEADAICARDRKEIRQIPQPVSLQGVPAYLEKSLRIAQREIRQLRALKVTPEQAPIVRRLLAEFEKVVAALKQVARHARAGRDLAASAAADRASVASLAAAKYADRLELNVCGRQPGISSPREQRE